MHPRLKRDNDLECLIARHRITSAIAQINSLKVLEGIAHRAEKDLSIIKGKVAQRRKSRARNKVSISASDTIWSD